MHEKRRQQTLLNHMTENHGRGYLARTDVIMETNNALCERRPQQTDNQFYIGSNKEHLLMGQANGG